MAGYAIQARVVSVRPRRTRSSRVRASAAGHAMAVADRDGTDARAFVIDRPPGTPGARRWAHIRQIWSQMTFFLFDPNSWR